MLFGSYAEGRATPDSDIDILVVTNNRLSRGERYSLSHKLFKDLSLSVQLILITQLLKIHKK
ncbi:MAG: nucleotidyltransferase domain-containing protein [Candidatus Thermoplasmatota archaeon]|nr:nucleotidyltransferase domain-containing protein [Candidatus Thermoplasmatota archaeon]